MTRSSESVFKRSKYTKQSKSSLEIRGAFAIKQDVIGMTVVFEFVSGSGLS